MEKVTLVIGNHNYSSWSLRAWLALRKTGASFETVRLPLDTAEFREGIRRYSPTELVPVLIHGECTVWESLAIAEHASEAFAGGTLWPEATEARALARSLSAEMHAGFAALRRSMPMNCRASGRRVPMTPELRADIDRVRTLWRRSRERFGAGGPWLFGRFSIADAMYAPVASRFRTYGVTLADEAAEYVDTVLGDADMAEWLAAARAEPETIDREEAGLVQ